MAKTADIGGKRLISLAPDAWCQWVTQAGDVTATELLDSQFQWVSRQNDALIKAYSSQLGEFLVLSELQLRYNEDLPRRMRAYAALAEEKYKLSTFPVLVNILPPSATVTIQDRFDKEFMGLQARQDYRVINLWDVDATLVFEQSLSALLPFVPILKGGGEVAVIQAAVQLLQQDEQLSELESLLGFFASFVLETQLVRQILSWDMAVLRESPWYQEIQQEGRVKEAQSLVLRLLSRRIGVLSPELEARVQALDLLQIESLGEALLDFNQPEDLQVWLEQC